VTAGLPAALRVHAQGLYWLEASAELVIAHRAWLRRPGFASAFIKASRGRAHGRAMAAIDWQAAITTLQAWHLPCSGGEHRILRIGASLAEGIPVGLRDALTGPDERNRVLAAAAVLHAGGRRPDTWKV